MNRLLLNLQCLCGLLWRSSANHGCLALDCGLSLALQRRGTSLSVELLASSVFLVIAKRLSLCSSMLPHGPWSFARCVAHFTTKAFVPVSTRQSLLLHLLSLCSISKCVDFLFLYLWLRALCLVSVLQITPWK